MASCKRSLHFWLCSVRFARFLEREHIKPTVGIHTVINVGATDETKAIPMLRECCEVAVLIKTLRYRGITVATAFIPPR